MSRHATGQADWPDKDTGRWEPTWEPPGRTTSCAKRTSTDRRMAIMPARGPIRTTLNAWQASTDLWVSFRRSWVDRRQDRCRRAGWLATDLAARGRAFLLTCPQAADPGLAHRVDLIRSLSACWR